VGGYLLAWLAFSLVATSMQWLLERVGLLDTMMMWSTDTALSGSLLVVAGIYQFSAPKSACLKHCRSPVEFVSQRWRAGRIGSATMGIEHGLYCVGCCWLVMALLFVGGIMNLVWIAGLAFLVLLEKLLPYERWVGRVSGLLMIAAAGFLLLP
jgi:predicted metal-binding membrane protein